MNKKDMLKAAQAAEEIGVDPDTVMVTFTLDEFAESHGDEVDTFDEDSEEIKSVKAELLDLSQTIEVCVADIEITEKLIDRTRNWAEKHELKEELRALHHRLADYRTQEKELITKLHELEKSFHNKYAR